MTNQILDVKNYDLKALSNSEILEINGGDTGYYGKGPDLNLLVDRVQTATGFVYGFFRSLI